MRLVHGIEAEHIGQMLDAFGYLGECSHIMLLQIVLDVQPIDHHLWREGTAAEEEREHGEGGEAVIVVRPEHVGEVVRLVLMQQGSAGLLESLKIQADCFQGPGGGAIAAGKATPDILMRVDEEGNVVFQRLFQQRFQVVEVGVIVAARSGVLNGFPGHEQAQEVQPPMLEAAEVLIGFFQREGATDKRDVAPFGEAFGQVGVAGRLGRGLCWFR